MSLTPLLQAMFEDHPLVKEVANGRGRNNYSILRHNGEVVGWPNSPCIASWKWAKHRFEGITEFFDHSLKEGDLWNRDLIEFIVNRSPWRDAFKTKSPEAIVRYGAFFDVTLPAPYVGGAVVAIRSINELPLQSRMWRDFCQYTDETTALWLVKYHRYSLGRTRDVKTGGGGGHSGMPTRPTKEQFNKFIKDDREYLLSTFPPMNVSSDYQDFQWGELNMASKKPQLFNFNTKVNKKMAVKSRFGSYMIRGVKNKDIEQHINELIELNKEA